MLIQLALLGSGIYFGLKTLAANEKRKSNAPRNASGLQKKAPSSAGKVKKLVVDMANALSAKERTQQKVDISADGKAPIDQFVRKMDHHFLVSLSVAGLSGIGVFLYPPLIITAGIGVLYVTYPIFQEVYNDFKKKRITTYLLDAVLVIGMLATGNIIPASLMALLDEAAIAEN